MQLYNSILTQQKQQQQAQPSGAGLFGNAPSPPHQNTGVHSTDVQSTGGGGGGGGSGGGGGLFQQSLAPASTQQPATSLVNPFLANARSSGMNLVYSFLPLKCHYAVWTSRCNRTMFSPLLKKIVVLWCILLPALGYSVGFQCWLSCVCRFTPILSGSILHFKCMIS